MRPFPILLVAIGVCGTAGAREREFNAIVHTIESRYETQRTHIPFFGLANFFVKMARPAGTSDLKLAIFEDLHRPMFSEEENFTGLVHDALGPDWHPFMRVHSRQDDEWTCIYSNVSGGSQKLLIATMERSDATVIRIKLNPKAMKNRVESPREHMRNRAGD